jgi:hypothetical protein
MLKVHAHQQASAGAFVGYNIGVQDNAQLRMKAEACRRLAELTEDAERKTVWLVRADHWESLAAKAERRQQRNPAKTSALSASASDHFGAGGFASSGIFKSSLGVAGADFWEDFSSYIADFATFNQRDIASAS